VKSVLLLIVTELLNSKQINPLALTVATWVQLKHPMPDMVKPSAVICNFWYLGFWELWRSGL